MLNFTATKINYTLIHHIMTKILLSVLMAFASISMAAYAPANRTADRLAKPGELKHSKFTPANARMHKPTKADGQLFKVNVTFDFKEGEFSPYYAIYNENVYNEMWPEENAGVFEVPVGTYDLCGQCWNQNGEVLTMFKESVTITGDTEIHFSTDEATLCVTSDGYLPDGRKVSLGILTDPENFEIDYTNATADILVSSTVVYRKNVGSIATGVRMANFGMSEEEVNSISRLIVSPLSDNYTVCTTALVGADEKCYVLEITGTGTEKTTIRNEAPFVMYQDDFVHSPVHDEIGCEKYKSHVTCAGWINEVTLGGGGIDLTYDNPEVWISAGTPDPDAEVRIQTVVTVGNYEFHKIMKDSEGFEYDAMAATMGLPVRRVQDGWEYINNNHSECGNYSFQCPEEDVDVTEFPGHPAYTFTTATKGQIYGDSAPLNSVMIQKNAYGEETIIYVEPAYIGRLGEVRGADYACVKTDFSYNGEAKLTNSSDYLGSDWQYNWSTDGHAPGKIDITFRNDNIIVDGLQGKNVTEVSYDERNEDVTAPTLQMLIFKDKDGKVIDRFDNAADGTMYFSGGDFQWHSDDRFYFTYEKAEPKVEYAPYGEDSFTALEVSAIPELFFMPGFGDCYSTNLAKVDRPSRTGWFDLRIEMTDKAGNRQCQTISPAFKINALSGIASVSDDNVKVWVADREIRTEGADGATMEVYSVSGQKMASTQADRIDASAWTPGIYVVRIATADTTSTHKVAIK